MAYKTKTLLDLDINKLTKEELLKYGRTLTGRANKQLRYWNEQQYQSPAATAAHASGGWFHLGEFDSLAELRKEFGRTRQFLRDATATRKGWEEQKRSIINQITQQTGGEVNLTLDNFDAVFNAYEKAKDRVPTISNKAFKYQALANAQSIVQGQRETKGGKVDTGQVAVQLIQAYTQQYQAEQEAINAGVSQLFK